MISLLNRLKKRKGFTIIEIVVVLAIIGVILAMVLPNVFTSDKPAKGNTLSKEFFYKAQDAMAISKIAYPEAFGISTKLIFYAELDDMGNITETGQYNRSGRTFIAHDPTLETDFGKMTGRFDECAKLYFSDTEGMQGTIFVAVNSDFMVESCYWLGMGTDDFIALDDYVFDDNNVISGYYAGAFPGALTDKGRTLFV